MLDKSTKIFIGFLVVAVLVLGAGYVMKKGNTNILGGTFSEIKFSGTTSATSSTVGQTVSGASQVNTSTTLATLNSNRRVAEVCNKDANTVTVCRSTGPNCVFGAGFAMLYGTSSPSCVTVANDAQPYIGPISVKVNATTSSSTVSYSETTE